MLLHLSMAVFNIFEYRDQLQCTLAYPRYHIATPDNASRDEAPIIPVSAHRTAPRPDGRGENQWISIIPVTLVTTTITTLFILY